MKYLGGFFFGVLMMMAVFPLQTAALTPDEIGSSTAVLMDAETGQVLFDKNMNLKAYPASTTKIMTGLLVCENCSSSETVTVNQSALDIDEWDSANIALIAGEQLSVDSAMYALILPSANDAANALAEHVSGSQQKFVQLMNERAAQIGAVNTHFANAHGLHDDDHYTTAYDLALITRYASHNPTFMTYYGAGTHTIPATNLQPIARPFTNYQYMTVKESQFYDPAVLGGKVGYTREAKHTMSTVARKYGRTLVCVVMGSPGRYDKFDDTQKLLDYGFNEFRTVTLSGNQFADQTVPMKEGGTVSFHSQGDFTALLRNDISISDIQIHCDLPEVFLSTDIIPTSVEVLIPKVDDTLPTLLGTQPLVTDFDLEGLTPVSLAIKPSVEKKDTSFPVPSFFYMGLVLFGVLCLQFLLLGLRQYTLKKRRQRRMKRLQQRMRYARPEPRNGPGHRIA